MNYDLSKLQAALESVTISAESVGAPIITQAAQESPRTAYQLAASVLTSFDADTLQPFDNPDMSDSEVADGKRSLLDISTPHHDLTVQRRWVLDHGARKRALAKLETRDRLTDALELAHERPSDPLQQTFEAIVRGTAKPLEQQSLSELRLMLVAGEWLEDTELAFDEGVSAEIQARISWHELMEPFRYLVKDGFQGRERELIDLHQHLYHNADAAKKALLIYGAGGVGKSTLLAQFILRNTDLKSQSERVPFSYVDFDAADISPQEPLTLLFEMTRQLAVQFPDFAHSVDELIEDWAWRRDTHAVRGEPNFIVEQKVKHGGFVSGKVISRIDDVPGYMSSFGPLIQSMISQVRMPWLLVLDTFEEVQTRSRDAVAAVTNFLSTLQAAVPTVRIMIAGRGEMPSTSEFEMKQSLLGPFDREAALGYLSTRGVKSRGVGEAIFDAVGGNALSLKLATEVVAREGVDFDAPNERELRNLLRKINEGNIQGQLYRRVLDHIENDDVRKLASPGLTLRRITPEIIEEVLAEPCGIRVSDSAEAERLFDLLKQEVSLITPINERAVRHRSDIRAVMLRSLRQEHPSAVPDIHRAAVAYYARQEGVEARAEEIYHWLFIETDLERTSARWERKWQAELDRRLSPALFELDDRPRRWLASQLGMTGISDAVAEDTTLPEWERFTERRVRDLMQRHKWLDALALLGERTERTQSSPLYFLEASLLRQQQRWEEARRVAYDGIYVHKQVDDNPLALLNLLRQAVAIDLHLRHYARVRDGLAEATQLMLEINKDNAPVELELMLVELSLLRGERRDSAEINTLRSKIYSYFLNIRDNLLLKHPQLIRDVLQEYARDSVDVLLHGLQLLQIETITHLQRDNLAVALTGWEKIVANKLGPAEGEQFRWQIAATTWRVYTANVHPRELTYDMQQLFRKSGEIESDTVVAIELRDASALKSRVVTGTRPAELLGELLVEIIVEEHGDR